MDMTLTAVIRRVPEGYVGWIEELPGVNVQEATLDELRAVLCEAAADVIAANRELARVEMGDGETLRETIVIHAA